MKVCFASFFYGKKQSQKNNFITKKIKNAENFSKRAKNA
jgi:hypothetical protein